ncbi:MAG: prolyl oligopeptidase family serine peptidase [Desulfobacteraceae bacterium]|nr:prolyl oligopeptidase family serine peptidase [Desulfobacteraceae bacterium]
MKTFIKFLLGSILVILTLNNVNAGQQENSSTDLNQIASETGMENIDGKFISVFRNSDRSENFSLYIQISNGIIEISTKNGERYEGTGEIGLDGSFSYSGNSINGYSVDINGRIKGNQLIATHSVNGVTNDMIGVRLFSDHKLTQTNNLASWDQNSEEYGVQYKEIVWVTSKDGTKIAANYFKPISEDIDQKFPTILFINSWAVEKHEYLVQAYQLARQGYLVFSYSARGWGLSQGVVNVAGPKDMEDYRSVVDYIIENLPADANNIGSAGISYGGGMSLLGMAHDTRIKTAVAMSGWTDIQNSLWRNETPSIMGINALLSSGTLTGRTDPILKEMLDNLINYENIEESLIWAGQRSAINYLENYNLRQTPIYISQNLGDEIFVPNPVMDFYARLTGPKKMDLNQGVHATAEIGGLAGLDSYIWNNLNDWFDYWLKGIDNEIMNKPAVSFQMQGEGDGVEIGTDGGIRHNFITYPSEEIESKVYYLSHRKDDWLNNLLRTQGKLKDNPQNKEETNSIRSAVITPLTTGIPVLSEFLDAHFKLPVLTSLVLANRNKSIIWESETLNSDQKIIGIPELNLWVQPTKSEFGLVAYLYEVDKLGIGTLLTHGPFSSHGHNPDQFMNISFELAAIAHKIKAGHKIAIGIDTSDLLFSRVSKTDYDIMLHFSPDQQMTLTLPFLK